MEGGRGGRRGERGEEGGGENECLFAVFIKSHLSNVDF